MQGRPSVAINAPWIVLEEPMDRVISRNQRTLDCTRGADGSCHQSQSTHLGLYSRSRWIVSSVAINAPWIVLEEPMDRVISRNQRTLDCTRGADGSCTRRRRRPPRVHSPRAPSARPEALPYLMREAIRCNQVQSGAIRSTSLPDEGGNQVQSGAIRCNQVQSEALPYPRPAIVERSPGR